MSITNFTQPPYFEDQFIKSCQIVRDSIQGKQFEPWLRRMISTDIKGSMIRVQHPTCLGILKLQSNFEWKRMVPEASHLYWFQHSLNKL